MMYTTYIIYNNNMAVRRACTIYFIFVFIIIVFSRYIILFSVYVIVRMCSTSPYNGEDENHIINNIVINHSLFTRVVVHTLHVVWV